MQINFNLRPELVDAACEELQYTKQQKPNETKEDFVGRMAKQMLKQMLLRRAHRLAVNQATAEFNAAGD